MTPTCSRLRIGISRAPSRAPARCALPPTTSAPSSRRLSTERPAYKPTPDVALGWFVSHGKLFDIVWKDGGTGGTCSLVAFAPKRGRAAVVLSNAGYSNNINDIGYHLIDPDLPVKPQRHAVPVDAAHLERLVGSYRFERFTIAVPRLGPRLF